MDKSRIRDGSGDRKYFTIVPNSVIESDISVYSKVLYVYLKKVAGEDGACWKSTQTMADECGMSKGKICESKQELADRGLIDIKEQKTEHGGRPSHVITITNVWAQNIATYDTSSQDDLQSSSRDDLASSPGGRIKEPFNKNPLNTSPSENQTEKSSEEIAQEYRERTKAALFSGIEQRAQSKTGIDLSKYPEDTVEVIRAVCNLWNLKPPRGSNRKNSPHAQWIVDARDLVDACGEFGVEAVREYRSDFEHYMNTNGGVAPFTVSGPRSLVKVVRAKAAEMRDAKPKRRPSEIYTREGRIQ